MTGRAAIVAALLGAPCAGAPGSASVGVEGPGVRIVASCAPRTPTVADTVTLLVRVFTEPGVRVDWPASLTPGVEVGGLTIARSRTMPGSIGPDGMLVASREFELEPFLPGEAVLGPFEFVATDGEGERRTLALGAITILVESVLPDGASAELSEPRGVVDAPEERGSFGRTLVFVGAGALVLAAGVGGVLVARRARRDQIATPAQRAKAALALLEDRVRGESGVGARPTSDEAYTALSSTLRSYIEERFGVPAGVLTTEEFFAHATTRARLPADATEALGPVLRVCDEVKFGGAEPGMRAAGEAIETVRAFVDRFGDPADGEGSAG